MATAASILQHRNFAADDEYFLRLFLLLKKVGTPLCLNIFHRFYPKNKSRLYSQLKVYERMLAPLLFPDQKDILFGSQSLETDSTRFDLTLLLLLIRKVCLGFAPPKNGWQRRPSLTDKSAAAFLIRLREFRNSLCHHGSKALSQAEYKSKWHDLSVILLSLGAIQSDIDFYLTAPLDSAAAKYDLVKEEVSILHDMLFQHMDVSFTKLSENEDKIADIQDEIASLQLQHHQLKRTVSEGVDYEPTIEDVNARLKAHYAKSKSIVSFLEWDETKRGCFKLEDIYVDLKLLPWEATTRSISYPGEENNTAGSDLEETLEQVLDHNMGPLSICIVGDPGRGKSIFLKKLAMDYANEKMSWLEKRNLELVLFISVNEMSHYHSLDHYLCEHCLQKKPRHEATVSNFLYQNSSKCLFLIDGIDESQALLGKDIMQDLEMLLKGQSYPGSSVIATSRPIGLDTLEKRLMLFKNMYSLSSFSSDDMQSFIRKYFSEKDQAFCNEFMDLISNDQSVLDLAASPLALTILCSLCETSDHLPQTTSSLYHQLVYQLIQQFKNRISHTGNWANNKRRFSYDILKSVGHVAFQSMSTGKEYFEQQDIVNYFVSKRSKTKNLFRRRSLEAVDSSSILQLGFLSADSGSNPRKLNWKYQFEPKMCQTYMAAEHIVETLVKHGIKGVRRLLRVDKNFDNELGMLKDKPELCQFIIDGLGRRGERALCKRFFNELFQSFGPIE